MTVGTGIVISVGIIVVAWIVTLCIGAWFANKKQNVTKKLTDELSAKILAHIDKKDKK